MELWLLGVGAIVLIAITVWIVWWPSRTEDGAPDSTLEAGPETATAAPQAATSRPPAPGAPARSDAATASTSEVQIWPPVAPATPNADEPWATPNVPRAAAAPSAARPAPSNAPTPQLRGQPPGPRVPAPALAVILSIASAAGGAWLYARWQRRRQRALRPKGRPRLFG